MILKDPYVSNLKTFTSKTTNQGCVLHVPALLGMSQYDVANSDNMVEINVEATSQEREENIRKKKRVARRFYKREQS